MEILLPKNSHGNAPLMLDDQNLSRLGITLGLDNVFYPIVNLSETGATFITGNLFKLGTLLTDVRISLENGIQIFRGSGEVIWQGGKNGSPTVVISFSSSVLPIKFIEALNDISIQHTRFTQSISSYHLLPKDFKLLVYEKKNYLSGLKEYLDAIESKICSMGPETYQSYLDVIDQTFVPDVIRTLSKFNQKLNNYLWLLDDKNLKDESIQFFRRKLNGFYLESAYAERAYSKPRGYAGDYEMMNQIYRNNYEGNSLFAKVMHKYTVNEAASKSVRFRRSYLKNQLEKQSLGKNSFTVASLASGSAMEVVDFLNEIDKENNCNYSFVLIDQDAEALAYAKRKIHEVCQRRKLDYQIDYWHISAKDIIEKSQKFVDLLGDLTFDLIYSAGLYDYLTRPIARYLTRETLRYIKSGGHLIIGNFHPSTPTRAISEFSVDWHLIYRSAEEMKELAPANIKKRAIKYDDAEILVFLELEK